MTAKANSSKRAKGKRAEQKVAGLLRKVDPDAKPMPGSGSLSHFPGDIFTHLPLHVEVKSHERIRLWEFWEQAAGQAGPYTPVLCLTANRRPLLAVVSIDTLVHLLQCEQQAEAVGEDRPARKWRRKLPSRDHPWGQTVPRESED